MNNLYRIFIVFLFGLFVITANSQISSFSSQTNTKKVEIAPYDSTINYIELGYSQADTIKLFSYIGQTLYVLPIYSKDMGYSYFYKSPKDDSSNRYGNPAKSSNFNTKYEDLVGKYFIVKDVFIDKQGTYHVTKWLKLENKDDSNDIVWYKYPEQQYGFNFLVLAYYEHIKPKYVGNYYAVTSILSDDSESVLAHKCIDIGIDDRTGKLSVQLDDGTAYPVPTREYGTDYYAEYGQRDALYKGQTILIFKDGSTIGESRNCIGIGYEVSDRLGTINEPIVIFDDFTYISAYKDIVNSDGGEGGFFIKKDYDRLIKKYGATWINLVVQHKIKVGMPEELVIMSWGKPKRRNKDSTGLNQLVYGSDYVYIKNGVVSSWQQY